VTGHVRLFVSLFLAMALVAIVVQAFLPPVPCLHFYSHEDGLPAAPELTRECAGVEPETIRTPPEPAEIPLLEHALDRSRR